MPRPAEIEFELCAAADGVYSLSERLVKVEAVFGESWRNAGRDGTWNLMGIG